MENEANYIGTDIGGTKIHAVRYSINSEAEAEITIPTESEKGATQVVANLIHAVETVRDANTAAVGVAWAGFTDSHNGVIIDAPNIPGFDHFPLAETMRKSLGLPVFVENDSRLFAYGEAICGAGKEESDILGIILGTGVGSGFIRCGEILTGSHGLAGEIGHTYLFPDHDEPAEYFLSGTGLHREFAKIGLSGSLNEKVHFWLEKEGQIYEIYEEWLRHLSRFTANLIFVFDPAIIVFGGGVGKNVLPAFLPQLEKNVADLLKKRNIPFHTRLKIAKLPNAGALGAALYARHRNQVLIEQESK